MKTAIVLFNLGGPDCPEAVQPFLFNLFSDPAIIRVPGIVRWPLAQLISRRRAPVAREIYAQLGGRSPIGELTDQQAAALQQQLGGAELGECRCFVAMRYWHPRAGETAAAVKAFGADRVVLLPLYPQYSTTTTGSSLKEWAEEAEKAGLDVPAVSVCCYPLDEEFIAAHVKLLKDALAAAPDVTKTRVLFSAHGLPKRVVDAGDPYQDQVERTSRKIVEVLDQPDLDWKVSYQSRVGPLEWIGPSTEACIDEAGAEGKGLIVVPVAFVSEHSETLVELDIEYKELADKAGVPWYVRAPALATENHFIASLAQIVKDAVSRNVTLGPACGFTGCSDRFSQCPARAGRIG